MIVNCPASCKACQLRDPKTRCDRQFLNISSEPIYAPGDMDHMFNAIVKDFGRLYTVNVLSKAPWVVTFDNFLNEKEMTALIATVGPWERSTDTGQTNDFGETGRVVSQSRTSSNAWCRHKCESHPAVQNVVRKIENVTRSVNHY